MSCAEVVVVGAGAAGLMAAIWAGRARARNLSPAGLILLDGAPRLGAKILVSGGGRCNVTHDMVDERAYAGSTRHAIRKIIQRFDAEGTVTFFRELGVELKREETGKLFPITDDSATVLDALLAEIRRLEVPIEHPRRVEKIEKFPDGTFFLSGPWGELQANRVILATGGRSLPKSGSDGLGYALAHHLGHSLTPRIFPSLVPLRLPEGHFLRALSGLTLRTTLQVRRAAGRPIIAFTDSTLCTHFGLSGPSVLDISRYYLDALADDPQIQLVINWLPDESPDAIDKLLQARDERTVLGVLNKRLPERLTRALCAEAGVEPTMPISRLTRVSRRALTETLTALPLPISGDRGFAVAEVTAGGVPLREINLATMESRVCPGLFLCGEICDVDGRIGGYNFQWAWSSGYVAGVSV